MRKSLQLDSNAVSGDVDNIPKFVKGRNRQKRDTHTQELNPQTPQQFRQ